METSLLARLLGTARTVTPITSVNAATLALTQLPLGQTVRAHVAARLADGSFRVVINDTPLRLALPAGVKAGDVVTLRLVAREPQLEFDIDRPLASAEPRLSGGARLIGQILSDPAPLRPRQQQPVAATPIVEAAKLREPLARAIQRSGLFYEAHQARWIDGDYPLAALQEEPQAALARQLRAIGHEVLAGRDRSAHAQLALNEAHRGRSIDGDYPLAALQEEQPQAALATQMRAMEHEASAGRDRPADAQLAPFRTAIRGQADSDPADAPERADVRDPRASGHIDAAGEDEVRGRDGNPPHAAAMRAPVGSSFDEEPAPRTLSAARGAGLSATTLVGDDDPAQATIVRELAPIVRQQLDAIETRQIVWQGELWPGQSLRWQITDREADSHHPESGREWLTRVALHLPTLGEVNADLAIGVHGVRIIVTARDGESADALRAATPELRQALAEAGLRVAALEVRLHER